MVQLPHNDTMFTWGFGGFQQKHKTVSCGFKEQCAHSILGKNVLETYSSQYLAFRMRSKDGA